MSTKFENAITKERVNSIQAVINSDIQKRYGENNAKAAIAERVKYYSNEYLFNRPVGMAKNYRTSDLQHEMKKYVEKRLDEDNPKGFLFGGEIILGWILSGIISYVIRMILNHLLDK